MIKERQRGYPVGIWLGDIMGLPPLTPLQKVHSIVFSEGTYQVELEALGDFFWLFLQMSEEGAVTDCFCSCEATREQCPHEKVALLAIFNGFLQPLHKRFKESLWNHLCQMASRRHGYLPSCLEKTDRYSATSLVGKLLCSIQPLHPEAVEKLQEMIDLRPKETEENSLKFSNRSQEEMTLWRQGRASEEFCYELSFWSDLAKWCMELQERKEPYKIVFSPQEGLPHWIHISFESVALQFYIARANWPSLIVSLQQVESPLRVYEVSKRKIQSVVYDPARQVMHLSYEQQASVHSSLVPKEGIDVEGWRFVPGEGFFSLTSETGPSCREIKASQIDSFLSKEGALLHRCLKEPIHEGFYPLQYALWFDEEATLHIEMFLIEKGDLQQEQSALFGSWVYLPSKGFYPVKQPLFTKVKTLIPCHTVCDFITRHRAWLSLIEGFEIHLVTLDLSFFYLVDQEGTLIFSTQREEDLQGLLDFGEWVFLPGRGFFPKRKENLLPFLRDGLTIPRWEVSSFIKAHQEDLKGLSHFFSGQSPIERVYVSVSLTKDAAVCLVPTFSLTRAYLEKKVVFFESYVYVEGEGFSSIDCVDPFLEEYLKEKCLSPKEESAFFSKLSLLAPYLKIEDIRLNVPKEKKLTLHQMQQTPQGWSLVLFYETEIGQVRLFDVWRAYQQGRLFYPSKAGLLDFSDPCFRFLSFLSKKKWDVKGDVLHLTTLEWMRLQAMEKVFASHQLQEVEVFQQFVSLEGTIPLRLDGLKSLLRGYQETGVRWLWFLYSYGLSGLLCDEMGLGKTHQAMALLSAISSMNEGKSRFLVVCPTSVIYHWEALLREFLPTLSVFVFHGAGRQLKSLKEDYDLLLTSYGIVRSERDILSSMAFQVAIYDEIQHAKNSRSQTHKALKSLQTGMRIGLTGTPIENRVLELKALFDLILPKYLPLELFPKEELSEEERETLSRLIHPFVLRRKKQDVLLELPEKIEEIAYCDLSSEQKQLYKEILQAGKEDPKEKTLVHIFSLLSRLKQVCDHPCLVMKECAHFEQHASGKWDLFKELLEEALLSGQKVVVFTQYLDMMNMIEAYLKKKEIGFAEIRGSTRDRKEALLRFKEDPACLVFVASLQAAGVGIDLTAASVVIHYDRWWNPAKENQATDRVHRMGQSRGVQVFKLVTKKTVEERIHDLIQKKIGLLDEVIGFDDQEIIKSLSREEVVELLASLEKDVEEQSSFDELL